MTQKIITHTVPRRDFEEYDCPECGGDKRTCERVHSEHGGEFYQCYACGTYFATVDDRYGVGIDIEFTECEGAPVTVHVENHPFKA